MLKVSQSVINSIEGLYPGFEAQLCRFEYAALPSCVYCGSENTADVQCGVIGRTIHLAASTTKFKLIPNGPKPGAYFCHDCEQFFNRMRTLGDGSGAFKKAPAADPAHEEAAAPIVEPAPNPADKQPGRPPQAGVERARLILEIASLPEEVRQGALDKLLDKPLHAEWSRAPVPLLREIKQAAMNS